jgi:YVTN family beta-propeller protein
VTGLNRLLRALAVAVLLSLTVFSFTTTSQVNANPDAVAATINVGKGPYAIAVNPNTNKIYVDSTASSTVSVVDGSSNSVVANITGVKTTSGTTFGSFGVTFRTGADVNPKTNRIYVTSQMDDLLYVIDGSSNAVVATVKAGVGPAGIAVNSNTNKIYVANTGYHALQFAGKPSISVIDGTTNAILRNIVVGSQPTGVAVNINTNRVYAANFGSGTVSVIDGSTDNVMTNITGILKPVGVAVKATKVYVASGAEPSLYVIDASNNTVVAKIKAGAPDSLALTAVALNADSDKIYALNLNSNVVSIIDGSTNALGGTIEVGNEPLAIAVNPNTNKIYVTNYNSDTVTILDGSVPIPSTTATSSSTTSSFPASTSGSSTASSITSNPASSSTTSSSTSTSSSTTAGVTTSATSTVSTAVSGGTSSNLLLYGGLIAVIGAVIIGGLLALRRGRKVPM